MALDMTATAYLPDLTHRAREPRWLDAADLPETLEPDWLRARYDELLAACDAAGGERDAWIELVLRTSELESFIGSHGSRATIAYRQDTADEAAQAELERWNREIRPVVSDCSVEVARRIVDSPCRDALAAHFGPGLLALAEAACRSHDPVNTALRSQLSDVLMRQTKIFGQGKITWRGEEHPFSFARKAAFDTDREERHAAWRSKVDYVRGQEDALQEVFDEALVLRRKMADNLGMSFTELRYLEMCRFDWTPEDAAKVRAAIERHVVPVASALQLRQAEALGTERLHPADEAIQPIEAPELRVEVDGQLDAATRTFDAMGDDFGGPWRMLVEEGLVDLPARAGKGPGAFCSGFPFERTPFIFCNSVGVADDVKTLVHEYGHALQGWRSREIEPVDLQHPTMEACEIHSMTLELLALPYLEPFFGADQLDHVRLEHLRTTLDSVPYMAAIDELQHRIYDEDLDAEGRAAAWRDVAARYQPAIDWDADEWYAGARWIFQLHVFQYPFYYLDYALARMVSWELWLRSLEDEQAALATYLQLCDLGGTKPFRQLVVEAGLGDPFDEATLDRTMTRLRPHLALD